MTSRLTGDRKTRALLSRISLSVLATVLMASSPAWAAPDHKTHAADSASADGDDAPVKASGSKTSAKAGAKAPPARHSEILNGDDDAAPKKKTAKVADADGDAPHGKKATPDRIQLADDDAKPAKGKKTATKLADADEDLVKGAVTSMHGKAGASKAGHDDDDAAPVKGKKTTKLADASDDDAPVAKGKKTAKATDDGDDAPVKGKSAHATKLADVSDDDAPKATARGKKSKAVTDKADDSDDDAPVKGHKATRLAAADDDSDTPVKSKKGAHAKAEAAEDDSSDDDSDDTAGFYKKVHGKLVLVSEKDIVKLRLVHHRMVPVNNGPFYHKVHGKAVRVTTLALAAFRKAHAPEADPNVTALAAAAHAMTTGTLMPAKLSVVTPMQKMTQPHLMPGAAPNPVRTALDETAKAASTPLVTLAAVTDALTKLPQSVFNTPGATSAAAQASSSSSSQVPAAPAAPIPYTALAGQTNNSHGSLSPTDAAFYQTAFSQIDSGDFTAAEATLAQVNDKSLVGYVEYHKLANPAYSASYEELTQYLTQYGDQPMAMRVWALAKRKKPYGAPDPAYPSLMGSASAAQNVAIADADKAVISGTNSGMAVNGVPLVGHTTLDAPAQQPGTGIDGGAPKLDTLDSDLTPKSARSAYNNGQYDMALGLARKIGDHWVAGLANWRLKHYADAEAEFKFVSTDPSRDAWGQSAGAFWAGRCADKLNQGDEAQTFYKIAASFPFTFYGLVAEQKLGVTPAVILAKRGQTPTFAPDTRQVLTASLTDDFAWTHNNAQAQRLSALVQIGRARDAQAEAQSAVQRAGDGTERDHWLALAAYNHIEVSQLHATDHLFDATRYPAPTIKLKSGYAVDRALLFAVARRESKFNTKAHSPAGAYGLLQLMPGTAALLENNSKFNSHPDMLYQPTVNMRVGQEYMQKLLDGPVVGGDLIRLIAAYNGGPGPVKDAVAQLGSDSNDSILLMESIPVAETRQYVEEVAANYWIYHQILGEPNKTLAQAAADNQVLVAGPAPAPATKTLADADEDHGGPGAAN